MFGLIFIFKYAPFTVMKIGSNHERGLYVSKPTVGLTNSQVFWQYSWKSSTKGVYTSFCSISGVSSTHGADEYLISEKWIKVMNQSPPCTGSHW